MSGSNLRTVIPSISVIGYIAGSFRQGLREAGYVEGKNVLIEYRWADGVFDRLPTMIADLVSKRVAVVTAWGTAARIVKNVHAAGIDNDIPVVFAFAGDPVAIGLVASLNRPGGNFTGITSIGQELGSKKRLSLLREIVPNVKTIALLANPTGPAWASERRDLESVAHVIGWNSEFCMLASPTNSRPPLPRLCVSRLEH